MAASTVMEINIRSARLEDLDRVIQLQSDSLKGLCAADYTPEQMMALVEGQAQYRGARELIWLAEQAEVLVGFAGLSVLDAQITAIYVSPQFARQGVGAQLLTAIEAAAIAKGYKSLWVFASLTAIPFYQAQGYQLTRQAGFWAETKVWIPCPRLEKNLQPLCLEKVS